MTLHVDRSFSTLEWLYSALTVLNRNTSQYPVARKTRLAAEKLGHAIEYLANDFVNCPRPCADDQGRLRAIELLSSARGQLHSTCVEVRAARDWRPPRMRRYAVRLPLAGT